MSTSQAIVQSPLYRAIWRWHFYAGLLVMPFLVLLAVTGGLYLFKPELDHLINRNLVEVPAREAPQAPPSLAKASVEQAVGGPVLQMILPDRPDRSISFIARNASGEPLTSYADPYDGSYLGSTPYGGLMQTIRKIHSLQLFGFWASSLIEIAAGWAIVMVGTGFFLWWPRGAKGGVVSVRGSPAGRMFWRDAHAVTGAFAGVFILFLAITGMPWSMFWGDKVQGWAAVQGLGKPQAPAEATPAWMLGAHLASEGADAHAGHAGHAGHDVRPEGAWALERSTLPAARSDPSLPDIGLDRAVARLEELGLPRPFGIQPPEGPRGAYVGSYLPAEVERSRTIYLDPRTGDVLGEIGYSDYGPAAKAIEWGIAVHQGQQYGPINRYLMLAACIAIVLLAVTSVVMWWKRRPKGKLGAPPVPDSKAAAWTILAIIGVAGAIFPLMGASLLVALAADWLIGRMVASRSSRPAT